MLGYIDLNYDMTCLQVGCANLQGQNWVNGTQWKIDGQLENHGTNIVVALFKG